MRKLTLLFSTILIASLQVGFLAAYDKNQPRVLAAFRPVVETAAKSTVRVFADGKRAALGFVIDKDGYILTKASQLHGELECQLVDGRKATAQIVGTEKSLDLAMLKVADWSDLTPIQWGDETTLDRGSWTVTPGIEQRDPVGIGVMSASPRSIPRSSGALGISLANVSKGAGIEKIFPKSPAEKAGLQMGDIVTHVGEKEVKSLKDLQETIFSYEPGDTVTITVRRKEDVIQARIVLGNLQQMVQGERAEFQNSLGGPLSERRAGFALVLQHDTVLKPIDCGGPLLDIEGKAVGMNIARAGRVETYALAASVIAPVIEGLKSGKYAPVSAEVKPDTAKQ